MYTIESVMAKVWSGNTRCQTRKDTRTKMCKVIEWGVLIYEWHSNKEEDKIRIQAAEMKFLRNVKGCLTLVKIENKYIEKSIKL